MESSFSGEAPEKLCAEHMQNTELSTQHLSSTSAPQKAKKKKKKREREREREGILSSSFYFLKMIAVYLEFLKDDTICEGSVWKKSSHC